jgi:hypothetical protein
MIEIAFSDSACGSLKMAQHYGKGKYHGGGVGVIVSHSDGSKPTKEEIEAAQREAEKREQLAWENAIPLGGNSADVYGFGLALSIGDISENEPDIRRKQVMEWLYSIYPDHEGHQAAGELLHRAKENLKTVRSRAAEGEALRVWYSNQPDELCGMYWLMAQLDPLKENCGPISLVRLPEWEVDENDNIVRKSGWGDIPWRMASISSFRRSSAAGVHSKLCDALANPSKRKRSVARHAERTAYQCAGNTI